MPSFTDIGALTVLGSILFGHVDATVCSQFPVDLCSQISTCSGGFFQCPNNPGAHCHCGETTEGDVMCAQYGGACNAAVVCTASTDCVAGSVCIINSCCDTPICLDLGTCANTLTPSRMFRRGTAGDKRGGGILADGGFVNE